MINRIFLFLICLWFLAAAPAQTEGIRIIYFIHADGNYLFHDEEGRALNAAERILAQSIVVGENMKHGEVFIFFQKPNENFLLLFPMDDGEFYYYNKGLKIFHGTYSRKNSCAFEPEADLIKKYSESSVQNLKNILLYYGHEIPLKDTAGYNLSQPQKKFGINIFAEGLKEILNSLPSPEKKFSIVVLSTCKNGNYKTAEELSPLTDYLIASPFDIHLSYLNSESLIKLSTEKNLDLKKSAAYFAESAYYEMTRVTNTEISISVYDLSKIPGNQIDSKEWVTNFYRPPMFGRKMLNKE
jgi:hypothetical protein